MTLDLTARGTRCPTGRLHNETAAHWQRDSRLLILGDDGVSQPPPVVRRLLGLGVR